MLTASPPRYFAGLDVHRDTIEACVYDAQRRQVCYRARFPAHDSGRLCAFIQRVRSAFGAPRCCYEASSCGYVLYHALRALGVDCTVIAPGSMPRRSGDRIKTDRRDAQTLAEYFAAGLLTACMVPDKQWESVRTLVRSRATLVEDLHRPKVRLIQLLRSRGHVYNEGHTWTKKFMHWVNRVELESTLMMSTFCGALCNLLSFCRRRFGRWSSRSQRLPRFPASRPRFRSCRASGASRSIPRCSWCAREGPSVVFNGRPL